MTKIRVLPQLLLDNLQPVNEEDYEFSDEEKEDTDEISVYF